MSEYAIIFQVLAALLALFFIFLTYMNTKTWRWVHVTMMFFVFGATVAFAFYAALTLKTRAVWIKQHDALEKQVLSLEEQVKLALIGDPKDTAGKTLSVASLREELGRAIIDRGRVWRLCQPQAFNPQQGTATVLTSPLPDPNLPPPPPKKNNIAVKTILHVFREAALPEGLTVPAAYVGEFEVTAVTDTSVTLSASMPLTPEQGQAGGAAGSTWSLYETCPVDGHEFFAGLDQNVLQAMMPALPGVPPDRYQKMIQSYVRDGKQAEATDPPENVWIEVKFLKKFDMQVDAANVATSFDAAEPLFPFNTDGQALIDRLRKAAPGKPAESVTFGPALTQIPTAVLDQQTADKLIADGTCEKIRPIFRRKLNDYELKFHGIYTRTMDLNGRIRQLKLDDQTIAAHTAKADQQIMLVDELKTKLTADLGKVKFEEAELDKYTKLLEQRLNDVGAKVNELYRSNKAMGAELAKLNADLTREIDRRTREATANSKP